MELSDHARVNRNAWNEKASGDIALAERQWARDEITWGIWNVPETEVGALPDVRGKDVVELGCGTAYLSAWLAKRGARPVGVDLTPAQLATARRLQAETGIEFPLVEADAQATGLFRRLPALRAWSSPFPIGVAARLPSPGSAGGFHE